MLEVAMGQNGGDVDKGGLVDRPSRGGLKAVVVAVVVVVGAVVVFFGVLGWLSTRERSSAPIDILDPDLGAHVIIEPDDELNVDLLGHPSHDQAAWVITDIDDTVVNTVSTRHEPRSGTAPDAAFLSGMPEAVQELWSTLPPPDRPPDEVNPDGGERWFYPITHFEFVGGDFGESDVRLELWVDDELIHSFEFSVTVVDGDACDYYVGEDAATKVPNRCG
jgi:hypothetical protein